MPPDRRTLREIWYARNEIKRYQINVGQNVLWFQFNPAATTSDPTYGTGPQRAWFPPVTIPVIIGEYQRAPKNFDDDGLYLVDRLHLILSDYSYFQSLIPDPDPTMQNHLNDRVVFDNSLFSVASFLPRGRVADNFLTISVNLIQVAASEMVEDVPIPMFEGYTVAN